MLIKFYNIITPHQQILVSIVVSIPACHAGDRGSIPRRGELGILSGFFFLIQRKWGQKTTSHTGNRTRATGVKGRDPNH